MMHIVELPRDWAVKNENFEKEVFLYMNKIKVGVHPGILYFAQLADILKGRPLEMRVKRTVLAGSINVPRKGTFLHAYVDERGKLAKTNIAELYGRVAQGEEVFPQKLAKRYLGNRLAEGPQIRSIAKKAARRTQRDGDADAAKSLALAPLQKRDLYEEKRNLQRAFKNWTEQKELFEENLLTRVEQGFYSSQVVRRAFEPKKRRFHTVHGARNDLKFLRNTDSYARQAKA